ncbi:MAG: NAD(P)-dependent dehydrogenase (short-subunit alcohol dehydrogenase family) [Limisphaerales bacterium]|jgi:NAD(P)-dependent dehydrogenase (short-subunit alcohol dehydrogenase family)
MNSLPCFALQDKVVIVTGAGRGLGRTMALDAFKSGARLAVGSRSVDEIQTLQKRSPTRVVNAFITLWMSRMSPRLRLS